MMTWLHSFVDSKNYKFQGRYDESSKDHAGLNFKTALESHIKWKQNLKNIINSSIVEAYYPDELVPDDQCILGQWLITEGETKFGHLPGFSALVTAHSNFHMCAALTLRYALDGNFESSSNEMTRGDFARASLEVSRHLIRLWRDTGLETYHN
jgi:hypothetical protein